MSNNKFLEKYPQLREPEVGDTVEIINIDDGFCYRNGDIGKIHYKESRFENVYVISFYFPNTKTIRGNFLAYKHHFKIIEFN